MSRLSDLTEEELVDLAVEDYDNGPTMFSLAIGFELGSRGWLPTAEQHERLHMSEGIPIREESREETSP